MWDKGNDIDILSGVCSEHLICMDPTSRYAEDFNFSQISKVWMLDCKQTTPQSSNRLSISGAGFEGAVVFKS